MRNIRGDIEGMARVGLLRQAEERLVSRLAEEPDNAALLERLGHIYRAQGRLEAAAELFGRLVSGGWGGAAMRELHRILSGQVPTESPTLGEPWPSPFVVKEAFLDERELRVLWAEIDAHAVEFSPIPIYGEENGEPRVDPAVRDSQVLQLKPLLDRIIVPKVRALLPELAPRLRLAPFQAVEFERKVVVHREGGHFMAHQDAGAPWEAGEAPPERRSGEGPAGQRRISFGFYFRRPGQRFEGGDLLVYDSLFGEAPKSQEPATGYTRILHRDNVAAFFRSDCFHESAAVRLPSDDPGGGRYAVIGHVRGDNSRERGS